MSMEKTRWGEVFHRAYCEVTLVQTVYPAMAELADAVQKWVIEVLESFSRFAQEVIEQWTNIVKTITPNLEKLVSEIKSAEDFPHSPQSFPHRRKNTFNRCKRNYLYLNTKGFCKRPVPCARSRC